jgi:hypothetical protein
MKVGVNEGAVVGVDTIGVGSIVGASRISWSSGSWNQSWYNSWNRRWKRRRKWRWRYGVIVGTTEEWINIGTIVGFEVE